MKSTLSASIIFFVSIVTGCREKPAAFQIQNYDGPFFFSSPIQSLYEPFYNQEQVSRGYTETECTCMTKSNLPQCNMCYNPLQQCVETECTCVTKPSDPVAKCSPLIFVPLKQEQVIDTECTCYTRQNNVPGCQCSSANCVPMKQGTENDCSCICVPVSQCSNNNSPKFSTGSLQESLFYGLDYNSQNPQQKYGYNMNNPYPYNSGYYY